MARKLIGFAIVVVYLLIVGCTVPAGGVTPAVWTPRPGQTNEEAKAAYDAVVAANNAATADARSTEQANTEATQVAAAATAVSAGATKQSYEATIQAGNDAVELQERQVELQIKIDEATRAAAIANGEATIEAQQTQAALYMQRENQRLANDATRHELEKDYWWSIVWQCTTGILSISLLVIVFAGSMILWSRFRTEPIVTNGDVQRQTIFLPDGRGGFTVYRPNHPEAIPQLPPPQENGGDDGSRKGARWAKLIGWNHPTQIPIGVNVDDGSPVLVDRVKTPHLLWTAVSGAGKSIGGLVPYTTAMWGTGTHVLVLNGKGSDFRPFAGWRNHTLVANRDELDMLPLATRIMQALVDEVARRDNVLVRYGARNWSDIPRHAGEHGEILLSLDEMNSLVDAAETAVAMERDKDKRDHLDHMLTTFWFCWRRIASQSRKYGIYMACTLTDATRDAIGRDGLVLARQMARIAFRMNSSAASRSFLGVDGNDGFPRGSAGLENGRFIYNIGGRVGEGVAFHPTPDDVGHYHEVWADRVGHNPLPDGVAEVVETVQVGADEYAPAGNSGVITPDNWPIPQRESEAAQNGRALSGAIRECRSLNDVGRALFPDGRTPSGQEIDTIIVPALEWRAQQGCEQSKVLLKRRQK
jgi:hypothetical protein